MSDTMQDGGAPAGGPVGSPAGSEKDARQWAMILHFSMLAGLVIPVLGLLAPIVVWQMKKDEIPSLDAHGKNATNWIISSFIYAVISSILIVVVIGFFMLLALGLLSIIFPIIACLKANNGETWKYPLSISFLK